MLRRHAPAGNARDSRGAAAGGDPSGYPLALAVVPRGARRGGAVPVFAGRPAASGCGGAGRLRGQARRRLALCAPLRRGTASGTEQAATLRRPPDRRRYGIRRAQTCGGRAKVSFLRYPGFDNDAHPCLQSSLAVYLPRADYGFRDFSHSENPPILHRKDALVDETYPLYQKFAFLTRQEEKRALLSRPDIGRKRDWEKVLRQAGLEVRGHRLFRRKSWPAGPLIR